MSAISKIPNFVTTTLFPRSKTTLFCSALEMHCIVSKKLDHCAVREKCALHYFQEDGPHPKSKRAATRCAPALRTFEPGLSDQRGTLIDFLFDIRDIH